METLYTCPMHPEIISNTPGDCPICGMRLEAVGQRPAADDPELADMTRRFWVGLALAIPVVIMAMKGGKSPWPQFLLATPVVLWCGAPFFKKGWDSLVNRSLNMFSLIAMGVGAAYLFSVGALLFPNLFPEGIRHQGEIPLYFESAAVIVVLVLLGQVIELKARQKTNRAIEALLERGAKTAHVLVDGDERESPIEEITPGMLLRVKPGEKVPVDGAIIEGESAVDESMISGESLPVAKEKGAPVIGGTLNGTGSFVMEAKKVGDQTLLAQIVKLVSEASQSRAPIQSMADKVASVFVPTVLVIALLSFFAWFFWGPPPALNYALLSAVSVLIIACPCALGLAVPLSIRVGMGKGAQEGILIKNSVALEKLGKITTLVVDKTGTLTEGKPRLAHIVGNMTHDETEILRLAAALEQLSEHPLAGPIVAEAKRKGLQLPPVEAFNSIPGGGLSGVIEGHAILIGKGAFLESEGCLGVASMKGLANEFQNRGQTALFIAKGGEAIGFMTLSDPIKPSTPAAIDRLHKMGIKIVMLSGDHQDSARAVAEQLGLDTYYAGVDPAFKLAFVNKLKQAGERVAMAGDGVNDAPALAGADVGITMGNGSDVALESAEVTLVKGDLRGIARAIILSREVVTNIHQNLFFAFIYNALGVPLAAGILFPLFGWLLNPMVAAAAMSLSSISVILNALRLNRTT